MAQLPTEALRRKVVDLGVGIAVGSNFVPGRVNALHKTWVLFGDLAEHEAGGRHVIAGHDIEQMAHAGLDTVLKAVPLIHRNFDALVPVLDID